MKITINEGSAFLICEDGGDINPGTEQGFYYKDTRFLSSFQMLINGEKPHCLSARKVNYYVSRHYMANPIISKDKDPDSIFDKPDILSITRSHIVENGLHDELEIQNFAQEEVTFDLTFLFESDFADIFEVKHLEIEKKGTISINVDSDQQWLVFHYSNGEFTRWLGIKFEIPFPLVDIDHNSLTFKVTLGPKESFHTCTIFYPGTEESVPVTPSYTCLNFNVLEAMKKDRSEEWLASAPQITSDNHTVEDAFKGAVKAIGSLRIHDKQISEDTIIPAAGMPWFVAFFGRDSIITSFQTMMNRRELAEGTIRTLARFQGKEINAYRDEEPGKILHEMRFGELAALGQIPHTPYYGSVDATPLFLILISELYLWTGDKKFVLDHMDNILGALAWINDLGDKDKDGYVEYFRESEHGLSNQGWKDSHDAIHFSDGTMATGPIALAEVQGYIYDAKRRMSRIFEDLGDSVATERLRSEAIKLKAQFNRDFWMPNEKYFAIGLDGNKNKIDCISSNPGHLLWSGIVDDEKKPYLIDRLMSPEMFSGWGVRTLSTSSARYNPLSYHNGSVWPHDNSLIAWGMRSSGRTDSALKIVGAMLEAGAYYEGSVLPELFCGHQRTKRAFPVEYPTSSHPQAWAAGASILFIRTILGLEVDVPNGVIKISPALPDSINYLKLSDIKIANEIVGFELRRDGDRTVTSIIQEPKRLEMIISKKK